MSKSEQKTYIAQERTEFGKGPSRRLRVDGRIPAVIYGHGEKPSHVSLDSHDATLAVRTANALMNISLDGDEQLTIVKEVQRHPVKRAVEHIDLLIVKAGEKITVEVPVVVEGEPAPGGVAQLEMTALPVEAEATNVPSEITVNIDDREIGDHFTAKDVKLDSGISLATEPEAVVVTISEPEENIVETPEDAEGEAAEGDKEDSDKDSAE